MCLKVYANKKDIPSDIDFVDVNDLFFDVRTNLRDDILVKDILYKIDKAEYISSDVFLGRTKNFGGLNKSMLSTGSKTLLNIINHPDRCFDVCECGNNALSFIPKIREGMIYWKYPAVAYTDESECDIEFNDKKFHDFYDFLNYVRYEYYG